MAVHCKNSSQGAWQPDERVVQQWVRHVAKLRRQVSEQAGDAARPVLRLVLEAGDVARFLTVPDGDGFMAAGLRVRLLGMDAPEIDQTCQDTQGREWPCGKRARWRLMELLKGRRLELDVHGVDCYGRLLCVCRADGEDVAEVMVREGLAVSYGDERYAQAEAAAARAGRGMWQGFFETPESWRGTQRSVAQAQGRRHKAQPALRAPRVRNKVRESYANAVSEAQAVAVKSRARNTAPDSSTSRAPDAWDRLNAQLGSLLKKLRSRR